jgi:inorganic pyrophosphatase
MADHGLQNELLALIEIPKGSRNKYEYDEGIGEVILDRFLSSSTVYPTDYGYLIGHRGRDGDPLDVLVCVSEPTFPGCVIPVKPIALFDMRDEKGQDDKIICVPLNDPGWNTLDDLDDLTEQFQLEVAHFFSVYKQLDRKPVEIGGWHSREKAMEVIADAKRLHEEEGGAGEERERKG